MKNMYIIFKSLAISLIFLINLFAVNKAFPQATGTLGIEAVGPTSAAIRLTTSGADSYRVEWSMDNVTYTTISSFADTTVLDNKTYHLLDGLTENTKYYLKLVPVAGGVDGTAVTDSVTTMESRMLIHMKFESATNGWTADEVTGKSDSLINASIEATGLSALGNAARFEPYEVIPGSGIYEPSSIFMDSVFHPYVNEVSGSPLIYYYKYTEASYSLWFKGNDPAKVADPGMIIASFGSSFGHGVNWWKDTLWVGAAAKFGSVPGNLFTNGGAEFKGDNTKWNHLAYVFKEGIIQVYLNGNKILELNQNGNPGYFWQAFNSRYSDHWGSNQLAACYWFNRGLNPVTKENLGDALWHHQFNGMIDEFKVFSYALSENEIQDMVAEAAPGAATVSIMGQGPKSIALKAAATDATSFKFEAKTGTDDFAEVIPALQTVVASKYYLLDGLNENSEYVIRTTPLNDAGAGTADYDTVMTLSKEKLLIHKFTAFDANGNAPEEITGESDSVVNATIVDGAIKFESKEVPIPGSGIYEHGILYLDKSLSHYWLVTSGDLKTYDYTEASYAFWFRVKDPGNLMANGGILAAMGDNNATCIALFKDTLWIGTGFKDGPNNIMQKVGMPFTSTDWTHVVLTFKEGITDLYVNGTKELTIDDTEKYFWNRFSLRVNDYWSKCNLGGVYNWNRGAKIIIDAMTGDPRIQFPFQGYIDEFNLYSYSIDQEEINSLVTAGHDGPPLPAAAAVTVMGQGPNSIALKAVSANATSFKFEIKTGTDDFAEATPVLSTKVASDYFLLNGLTEHTQYVIRTTPVNDEGVGPVDQDTVMTLGKDLLIHHKFNALVDNYYVMDEITQAKDSLENATIENGAVRFKSVETIPGSGIYKHSIMYLNNSLTNYWLVTSGSLKTYDYTEASYAFWFKVDDPSDMMQNGGILAAMGDNNATCVALFRDSLWIGTGFKDGPNNIMQKAGMPFTSTEWTHVALTIKEGITDLYVNGNKELTIDDTEKYFWNRFSLRVNDYWSKCNLGGVYNWNRGAKIIIDAMTGDPRIQFPFQGYIDDFVLYSYAIEQATIDTLIISDGIGNISAAKPFVIYPNPASGVLYLNSEVFGNVEIYDLTGKMIMSEELYGESEINVSSLKTGLYIIKVRLNNATFVQKLIIK